jgi:hypothetical protein
VYEVVLIFHVWLACLRLLSRHAGLFSLRLIEEGVRNMHLLQEHWYKPHDALMLTSSGLLGNLSLSSMEISS